jgi:mono/diheme cytochrome c family protein
MLVALAGCEVFPAPDLERMIEQRNLRPFGASPRFGDGRAMRPPPADTIARETVLGPAALTTGASGGRAVDEVPVAVTGALLARGRNRFDVFCAACHGLVGDGASDVATNMALRKPPSLVDPPVTGFPAGRVFQVIGAGYGLMPSYAQQLPVHDRWAVVAYVQALQIAERARLADLPPDLREEAARALERP